MAWIRDRALTLALMAMFLLFLAGQLVTGFAEYNSEQTQHGLAAVAMTDYLATGHPWEAIFENWESEFLQMAAFVLLTTFLIQKGSPESDDPGSRNSSIPILATSPTTRTRPGRQARRLDLALYEHSLGLAFVLLFLIAWVGHALGGFAEYAADQVTHHQPRPALPDYLMSARFWFESFQNWQSEFLAIASMVWLAVYLRQRGRRNRNRYMRHMPRRDVEREHDGLPQGMRHHPVLVDVRHVSAICQAGRRCRSRCGRRRRRDYRSHRRVRLA